MKTAQEQNKLRESIRVICSNNHTLHHFVWQQVGGIKAILLCQVEQMGRHGVNCAWSESAFQKIDSDHAALHNGCLWNLLNESLTRNHCLYTSICIAQVLYKIIIL